MDLLNLSLVSPEAGEPWSVNAARGVGRQARKYSCRKVLQGWVGWTLVSNTEQPCQVFARAIVIFLSFLPLEQIYPFYITTLKLPQAWGRNTPVLAFVSSAVFEEWGKCGFFCKQQPKKQKGEMQAWEFSWPMGQIDVMLQIYEVLCGNNAYSSLQSA